MEAATTHPAAIPWFAEQSATRILSATLGPAVVLLRALACSCRQSPLPETPAGAGFSMLPRRERDRVLNQGYRPY